MISNAIKFSFKRDKIEVVVDKTIKDERSVVIAVTVKDRGIGMSQNDVDNLFKPYFRTSDSKSKRMNASSHGLGLSICHKICVALGGEITVKSSPDIGSDFTFTFTAERVVQVPRKRKNFVQGRNKLEKARNKIKNNAVEVKN